MYKFNEKKLNCKFFSQKIQKKMVWDSQFWNLTPQSYILTSYKKNQLSNCNIDEDLIVLGWKCGIKIYYFKNGTIHIIMDKC